MALFGGNLRGQTRDLFVASEIYNKKYLSLFQTIIVFIYNTNEMAKKNGELDIYSSNQSEFVESYDDYPYVNEPLSVEESLLLKHKRTTHAHKAKKVTTAVTTIAATLVASALGIVGIINPLLNRPKVTDGKYQVVENTITYSFKYTATNNYQSYLLLYFADQEIGSVEIKESKTYEGSFTLSEAGEYHLDIYSTNNIDYKKQTKLYTFIYQGV